MDRETELLLVGRVRSGDTAAFDEIYALFNRSILTFLLRLSRRRDVAEDLVEETWLRFVRHAHRLRPDTRLAAWLYTVARRLHLSYVRSRMIEDSAAVALMALWPVSTVHVSPFEETAANELERRIERALASLSSPAREVLLLVSVAGLSPADAAEVCGVSSEALRQRLSRARRALARALERDSSARATVIGEVTP